MNDDDDELFNNRFKFNSIFNPDSFGQQHYDFNGILNCLVPKSKTNMDQTITDTSTHIHGPNCNTEITWNIAQR